MPKSTEKFTLLPRHSKAARGLLEWTQGQLAEAAGLNQGTISAFEAGTSTPSEDSLLRIETALKAQGIVFYNHGNPGVRLILHAAELT